MINGQNPKADGRRKVSLERRREVIRKAMTTDSAMTARQVKISRRTISYWVRNELKSPGTYLTPEDYEEISAIKRQRWQEVKNSVIKAWEDNITAILARISYSAEIKNTPARDLRDLAQAAAIHTDKLLALHGEIYNKYEVAHKHTHAHAVIHIPITKPDHYESLIEAARAETGIPNVPAQLEPVDAVEVGSIQSLRPGGTLVTRRPAT